MVSGKGCDWKIERSVVGRLGEVVHSIDSFIVCMFVCVCGGGVHVQEHVCLCLCAHNVCVCLCVCSNLWLVLFSGFGISSKLWDYPFGTLIPDSH